MTGQPPTSSASGTDASTMPDSGWSVQQGDSLELLARLPGASFDAVVTDPPYGINFQGLAWDGQTIRSAAAATAGERLPEGRAYEVWCRRWATACLRVLKPGAHLVAFGAPRTAHRLACGLEDAGLELRDTLMWLYGTGMPKSRRLPGGRATQLKPAYEPILLARKPLDGTTERNLKRHGTGALNTRACTVHGRHPANVVVSHSPGCRARRCQADCAVSAVDRAAAAERSSQREPARRLFYCPKASRRERDLGCERLPRRRLELFPNAQRRGRSAAPAANSHPTVKPLALMRWLIQLICPGEALVLDPFCGSGSTGCAAALEDRRFLGIELDPNYVRIARARINHWNGRSRSTPLPSHTTGPSGHRQR